MKKTEEYMINTITVQNFTVFKNIDVQLSPGLNVFIGENGTGKSHILKLAYAVLRTIAGFDGKEPPQDVVKRAIVQNLVQLFCADSLGHLVMRQQTTGTASVIATWGNKGKIHFAFSGRNTEKVSLLTRTDQLEKLPSSILFLPPKEILSVFRGFQAALERRELAFDATYLDLAKALGVSPLKEQMPVALNSSLKQLQSSVGASVSKKNDTFYFKVNKSGSLEAQIMAEGYRKLGMLAYLITNGELRPSSSLFWDEPEANLNPKLLGTLANILAELSKVMQVTIATHSLFLLRALEILQEQKLLGYVRYFGLHPEENGVAIKQGESANDIGDIASLDASIAQSDTYLALCQAG